MRDKNIYWNANMIAFTIYFFSMVIEAPIRFILNSVGMPFLLYIRDLLLLIVMLIYIIREVDFYDIFLIVGIIPFIILGMVYTNNFSQVLWGIKTIYPFYFGFFFSKDYISNIGQMGKLYYMIFFLGCIGVLLNWYLVDPFWTHLPDNELTGIENVRTWNFSYEGESILRLGGFSRTSIDAAMMIMFSSLWIFIYGRGTLIFGFLALICIGLTTTKANIITELLIYVLMIFKQISHKLGFVVLKFVALIGVFIMAFIPIASDAILDYLSEVDYGSAYVLVLSLGDRMLNAWPSSWSIIRDYGNVFLGRGIGGIGFSTIQFEQVASNPSITDSTFLYLYGSIGIFSIIILGYVVKQIKKIKNKTKLNEYMILVSLAFFFCGITTDMLNQIVLIHIGIFFKWLIVNDKANIMKISGEN